MSLFSLSVHCSHSLPLFVYLLWLCYSFCVSLSALPLRYPLLFLVLLYFFFSFLLLLLLFSLFLSRASVVLLFFIFQHPSLHFPLLSSPQFSCTSVSSPRFPFLSSLCANVIPSSLLHSPLSPLPSSFLSVPFRSVQLLLVALSFYERNEEEVKNLICK